jgi:hypothetical protein
LRYAVNRVPDLWTAIRAGDSRLLVLGTPEKPRAGAASPRAVRFRDRARDAVIAR